jgi:osmoprotectant transport system permease protein
MTMLEEAWTYVANNPAVFRAALATHLWLSGVALLVGVLTAVPLGIWLSRYPRLAEAAINAAGILRTIPSLAILAIMLPILGTGFLPSVVALIVYAISPILINTYIGIKQVDPDAVDAALGMGMTRLQIVGRIEVPLAIPIIFAGIRTAAVQVVAGATLAAFIGGGGLGDFITAGIAIMDSARLLVGAIPVALLAIATELIFGAIERLLTSRGMRVQAA